MKNIYFLLTILALCFYGCKKENDFNFVNPSIRLGTIEMVASNQAQLKISVNLGAGFNGHRACIQLTDISMPASQKSVQNIPLNQETNQEHTLLVNAPVSGHDYQVMGILETEKNRFETGKEYLFFSQKSHKYDVKNPYVENIPYYPDYPFQEGNIARITQGGDMFWIQLNNKEKFDIGQAEVTLNQSISLECVYQNEVINPNSSIGVKLPTDMEPGDYTVQLILDGEKWDVKGLIRIHPWKTNLVDIPFGQHSFYGFYASFTLNNQIYYVQYHDHNQMENNIEYRVWSYDIATEKYTYKKNWKLSQEHPMLGISYQGKGYCLVKNDNHDVSLWSYTPETDEWERLSSYPGKGKNGYVYFTSDDCLYLGGGIDYASDKHVGVNDFWRFNFQTQEWVAMADIPFTSVNELSVNSTCTDGETAYTLFYDRTLWSYHVPTNQWKEEAKLNSGPFYRYSSPLCMWEGKVCLIGTYVDLYEQYKDIQLYDPETKEWTLVGFFNFEYFMSSSFTPPVCQKDDSIYMGPLQQHFSDNSSAPKFIQITPQ